MKQSLNPSGATSQLPLSHSGKARETDQLADPPAVEVEITGRALDQAVRDEFDRLLNLRSTHEAHRG